MDSGGEKKGPPTDQYPPNLFREPHVLGSVSFLLRSLPTTSGVARTRRHGRDAVSDLLVLQSPATPPLSPPVTGSESGVVGRNRCGGVSFVKVRVGLNNYSCPPTTTVVCDWSGLATPGAIVSLTGRRRPQIDVAARGRLPERDRLTWGLWRSQLTTSTHEGRVS